MIYNINKYDEAFISNNSTRVNYKKLYNSGIEPNLFLNDFLEVLYFVKNISYIENGGNNFALNASDY